MEQAVKETTNDIGALDGLSSIAQSRMQQNEAEYQQHLAQLQTRDSQMQQQLDAALVQLQAAYDQLAVQQTVQQDTYSSGSGGGQPNGSDENDHRET